MINIKNKNLKSGFTLMEMVVVIGIVALITVVVLGSYSLFAGQFSLSRVARELALEFRHAQVFGLAVREFPDMVGVYPPYGISISPGNSRSPFVTTLFGDLCDQARNCDTGLEDINHGDGIYEEYDGCGTDVTECVSKLIFKKDAELLDICVTDANMDRTCWEGGSGELKDLYVSFKRPDPEAIIRINDSPKKYVSAEIRVRSIKFPERAKSIRVWVTGQVSISDYDTTQ